MYGGKPRTSENTLFDNTVTPAENILFNNTAAPVTDYPEKTAIAKDPAGQIREDSEKKRKRNT